MIHKSNHKPADQFHFCQGSLENKPQIKAEERGFVHLDIQHFSEVYPLNGLIKSPQSTQRAQSSAIPVTTYEKAAPSRFRTRMTRIFTDKPQRSQRTQRRMANLYTLRMLYGILRLFTALKTRIYTYQCASASDCISSTFLYVHPRQILSMKEKTATSYYALINKDNTIFNQKSDLNDRHLLLQRA